MKIPQQNQQKINETEKVAFKRKRKERKTYNNLRDLKMLTAFKRPRDYINAMGFTEIIEKINFKFKTPTQNRVKRDCN